MKEIDFYVGPGSRYCYLASTQLPRIAAQWHCHFNWIPIFSGDLIPLSGTSPFEGRSIRGQYDSSYRKRDAERWAKYYKVEFTEPTDTEIDWRLIAEFCCAVPAGLQQESLVQTLLEHTYVKDNTPQSLQELCEIGSRVGIDIELTQSYLRDGSGRKTHEKNIRRAHERGVFGVPTFSIEGQIFWGQDRLVLLEHYLSELETR